jgi:hypothetical protein
MPVTVTEAERASFLRCRRQWDFQAGMRQNLEPRNRANAPDLDRAIRDALAVYYFPGMWDWDRRVRLPLVGQELDRALEGRTLDEGKALLDRYVRWAPTVDRFAPVLVETDFEATVLDPDGAAVVTAGGEPVRYRGRIDLMAVDAHDAYWIVRHRVVDGDWPPTQQLLADDRALAACWAWEQFYLGMAITGTIYNELKPVPDGRRPWPRLRARRPWPRLRAGRPRVRQHEPSGGGRSVPQHRRMYARAREPVRVKPVEQHTGPGFRRTWLRHHPDDVAAAGQRLGHDVAEMARQDLAVYPEPSDQHCPACPYLAPCLALRAGTQPSLSEYRPRPPDGPREGRLGGRSWSLGRGAAPPKFRRGPAG